MIPFNEIDERLKKLGKNRTWLSDASNRKPDSIRVALAPNAPPAKRSELLQKALSDSIEREESIHVPKTTLPDQLALTPTASEFDAWCRAYKASASPTLKDWAIDELNKAAAIWKAGQTKATSKNDDAESNIFWLKSVGGIAAGAQITNDSPRHKIQVAKPYPADHYALTVHGRSMEPDIADGSIIVVQRLKEGTSPKQGRIVVYSDAYGLSLKKLTYRKAKEGEEANKLGKVAVLESINPEFPEVTTMDGGRIEAVFVEVLT